MDVYNSLSINFFAIIILVVVLSNILIRKNRFSISFIFFTTIIVFVIVCQSLEIAGWLIPVEMRYHLYIVTFFYNLLGVLPAVCLLCYIDYQLFGSLLRLKRRFFYLHLFIVYSVVMLVSLKSGFIFSYDNAGVYARGPGIILGPIITFMEICFGFWLVLSARRGSEKRYFITLLSFTLLPFAGVVLQLKRLGLNLTWPGVTASVLVAYLFIELQQETRDYLTGLYNRQQIDEIISFKMRKRRSAGSFSLVMIDLNDFKDINDQYGHDEGDNALIIFSNLLMRNTKRVDVAARFAGDEFLLLLENIGPKRVDEVIQRLRESLAAENNRNGLPYDISFSCGQASYDPEKHSSYCDILQEADEKMYSDKRRMKGCSGE